MSKEVIFSQETREGILEGLEVISEAVGATIGPAGRNVLIDRHQSAGGPYSSRDGALVALSINLEDRLQNLAASLVKEACQKTNSSMGDGTSTTTLLTCEMVREGIRLLAAGHNPLVLQREIQEAVKGITDILKGNSEPCKDSDSLYQIAYLSSNRDNRIADLISDAIRTLGTEGTIESTLHDGETLELEVTQGVMIRSGYKTEAFLPPGQTRIELEDAYVVLLEGKLNSVNELEAIARLVGTDPVLFIGEVEGAPLQAIVASVRQGSIRSCIVELPSYGDEKTGILGDLAIMTDGIILGGLTGDSAVGILKELSKRAEMAQDPAQKPYLASLPPVRSFGRAKKITIERDRTVISGGSGDVSERVQSLLKLSSNPDLPESTRLSFKRRAGYLSAGVAYLKVGGITPQAREESRMRVDDAIGATKAAATGGVVSGGGTALLRAGKVWSKGKTLLPGHRLVLGALRAPMRQIVDNSGYSGEYAVMKVLESPSDTLGFDVVSQQFLNMLDAQILDPTEVLVSALQYSSSVASMVLTCEAAILEFQEKEE